MSQTHGNSAEDHLVFSETASHCHMLKDFPEFSLSISIPSSTEHLSHISDTEDFRVPPSATHIVLLSVVSSKDHTQLIPDALEIARGARSRGALVSASSKSAAVDQTDHAIDNLPQGVSIWLGANDDVIKLKSARFQKVSSRNNGPWVFRARLYRVQRAERSDSSEEPRTRPIRKTKRSHKEKAQAQSYLTTCRCHCLAQVYSSQEIKIASDRLIWSQKQDISRLSPSDPIIKFKKIGKLYQDRLVSGWGIHTIADLAKISSKEDAMNIYKMIRKPRGQLSEYDWLKLLDDAKQIASSHSLGCFPPLGLDGSHNPDNSESNSDFDSDHTSSVDLPISSEVPATSPVPASPAASAYSGSSSFDNCALDSPQSQRTSLRLEFESQPVPITPLPLATISLNSCKRSDESTVSFSTSPLSRQPLQPLPCAPEPLVLPTSMNSLPPWDPRMSPALAVPHARGSAHDMRAQFDHRPVHMVCDMELSVRQANDVMLETLMRRKRERDCDAPAHGSEMDGPAMMAAKKCRTSYAQPEWPDHDTSTQYPAQTGLLQASVPGAHGDMFANRESNAPPAHVTHHVFGDQHGVVHHVHAHHAAHGDMPVMNQVLAPSGSSGDGMGCGEDNQDPFDRVLDRSMEFFDDLFSPSWFPLKSQ